MATALSPRRATLTPIRVAAARGLRLASSGRLAASFASVPDPKPFFVDGLRVTVGLGAAPVPRRHTSLVVLVGRLHGRDDARYRPAESITEGTARPAIRMASSLLTG